MTGAHYTFGENERAAERLRLLAEAFEPSSAELLQSLTARSYDVAIDLGCGPGYTTELIQRMLRPKLTVGVDRSAALLSLATQRALRPGLRFEERDVTAVPLSLPPADLLYCRYLLTHLPDPSAVLLGWATALSNDGLLVLEETSAMASNDATFRSYYDHVEQLQRHYGQLMYIGATLPELCIACGYRVVVSHDRELRLPAATMARLHALNLDTWSKDPYAQRAFDAAQLEHLALELSAVSSGARRAPPVRHRLRQMVVTPSRPIA